MDSAGLIESRTYLHDWNDELDGDLSERFRKVTSELRDYPDGRMPVRGGGAWVLDAINGRLKAEMPCHMNVASSSARHPSGLEYSAAPGDVFTRRLHSGPKPEASAPGFLKAAYKSSVPVSRWYGNAPLG